MLQPSHNLGGGLTRGRLIKIDCPMKKSCQDLEKNLGKIFSRSCKNLARYQAIQDFRMDLEQESCKIRKILASSKSWHGFGTDFLPTCQILKRLGKTLQDIFDRACTCTVVPLMRDHKESSQKTVSQKGFALFGG